MKAYPEQIAAGKILLENKLAQMQTGEGKTLAAVFTAIVHVKRGRKVHIFTANQYLACRDSRWMAEIYSFFGLKVSSIEEEMSPDEKRLNYKADIVYLTAKQAGFDYLQDCLETEEPNMQGEFDVCIVDEADFIMIDEARTPLVIARARRENYVDSIKADSIAKELKAEGCLSSA
jgi:preprotein translocase subunit SecA